MGHAGFDRLTYPGDEMMQLLYDKTNLSWTGFYLAPAPSQPYTGWMTKRALLSSMGWGFAPIYVGQQTQGRGSHIVTARQGSIDAGNAARLAQSAGFPANSVIYLDIEQSWTTSQTVIKNNQDYYKNWSQGIFERGYYPGVYCFPLIARALMKVDRRPLIWAINVNKFRTGTFRDPLPFPDPEGSGLSEANVWQLVQKSSLQVTNNAGRVLTVTPIDLDSADSEDPSRFIF